MHELQPLPSLKDGPVGKAIQLCPIDGCGIEKLSLHCLEMYAAFISPANALIRRADLGAIGEGEIDEIDHDLIRLHTFLHPVLFDFGGDHHYFSASYDVF